MFFVVEFMKAETSHAPRKRGTAMVQAPAVDRSWIAAEFVKGIAAERSLAADAKARATSPPDPSLGVLYHEIAAADERHATILETIATRFGHTPSASGGGGVGLVWDQLKNKLGNLGTSAWTS